jgi:hypothetical protein
MENGIGLGKNQCDIKSAILKYRNDSDLFIEKRRIKSL